MTDKIEQAQDIITCKLGIFPHERVNQRIWLTERRGFKLSSVKVVIDYVRNDTKPLNSPESLKMTDEKHLVANWGGKDSK